MHNYNDNEIRAALLGDGVVGDLERRFEVLFKNHFHCLSVMNATCGLTSILRCLRPGKVIAPLFTSPATWAAIEHAGHEWLACDIDPVSVCLSPHAVGRQLEATRRDRDNEIRAIVAVNIFGHMSELARLSQLAKAVGALLIVDAAQSLATCLNHPDYLKWADAVVFSLGPNKWLSCADGGMIAVKSLDLWQELILLTQPVARQMLDVPQAKMNLAYHNYRINPYTARCALAALQDFKQTCASVQRKQTEIIRELLRDNSIEQLPQDEHLVYEPITGIPLRQLDGFHLNNLPLPVPLKLVDESQLSETLRQVRLRKVIQPVEQTATN